MSTLPLSQSFNVAQVLTSNVLSDFSGYFMEDFKESDPDCAGAMSSAYNRNDNIKLAQ